MTTQARADNYCISTSSVCLSIHSKYTKSWTFSTWKLELQTVWLKSHGCFLYKSSTECIILPSALLASRSLVCITQSSAVSHPRTIPIKTPRKWARPLLWPRPVKRPLVGCIPASICFRAAAESRGQLAPPKLSALVLLGISLDRGESTRDGHRAQEAPLPCNVKSVQASCSSRHSPAIPVTGSWEALSKHRTLSEFGIYSVHTVHFLATVAFSG